MQRIRWKRRSGVGKSIECSIKNHSFEQFLFCIFSAKLLTCYSEDHIKVHFSDYACIDVVPLKHLRELLNEFKLLPEQAIQAKLYGKSTIF